MIKINKIFYRIIFFQFAGIIFLFNNIQAQEYETENRTGTVTYISSQNIYVQFDKLESIIAGDTLYLSRNGKDVPAMVVKYISSRSCAGINISGSEIKKTIKLLLT